MGGRGRETEKGEEKRDGGGEGEERQGGEGERQRRRGEGKRDSREERADLEGEGV